MMVDHVALRLLRYGGILAQLGANYNTLPVAVL